MPERNSYEDKKAFFDRMLTVYGRKPVLEALQDEGLQCHALHLAQSNREAGIIGQIKQQAQSRAVPIKIHSREELARISKNGKQDQGVAVDIICPGFRTLESYVEHLESLPPQRLLALDSISNPQNLGMIIRSATAGQIDGIIWSRKGNAALGPLVIKASAGTLYKAPILLCPALPEALRQCQVQGVEVCILAADAKQSLFEHRPKRHCIYVLGNETDGVVKNIRELVNTPLSIPMGGGVESLNVAVTASLIAYATYLER